jgi:hypothetical protein
MGIVININSDDAVDVIRSSAKGPKEKIENHFISLVGMPKAKRDKLLHYAGRAAKEFFQFDAFTAIGGGDDIMRPDEDGDCLCSGTTTELMFGASVRVFIAPDTSQIEAVRALKKIKEWVERDADALNTAKLHGVDIDMPF